MEYILTLTKHRQILSKTVSLFALPPEVSKRAKGLISPTATSYYFLYLNLC